MSNTPEPIACNLGLREGAAQAMEWVELADHAISRERISHGYAVIYPDEMADTVRDLAAREARCCGWLSISTSQVDGGVRLELASDHPDAGPVLALLAGDRG